jgi:RNA polymerase sigma-70 factor, ECF subfamily
LDKYQGMVYRQALKYTRNPEEAEDITQDVFLQAFEKLSSFRGEAKFSTWLFRIGQNILLQRVRKGKVRPDTHAQVLDPDLDPKSFPVNANCPETQLLEQESKQTLVSLLARLPITYKNPLQLYYFEGLSYQEISERLNLKINTLKSHILRGKELLKKWVQNAKPEDETL